MRLFLNWIENVTQINFEKNHNLNPFTSNLNLARSDFISCISAQFRENSKVLIS